MSPKEGNGPPEYGNDEPRGGTCKASDVDESKGDTAAATARNARRQNTGSCRNIRKRCSAGLCRDTKPKSTKVTAVATARKKRRRNVAPVWKYKIGHLVHCPQHKASRCTQPFSRSGGRWLAEEVEKLASQNCRPGEPGIANHQTPHEVHHQVSRRRGASDARNQVPEQRPGYQLKCQSSGRRPRMKENKNRPNQPTTRRPPPEAPASSQTSDNHKQARKGFGVRPDIPPTRELECDSRGQVRTFVFPISWVCRPPALGLVAPSNSKSVQDAPRCSGPVGGRGRKTRLPSPGNQRSPTTRPVTKCTTKCPADAWLLMHGTESQRGCCRSQSSHRTSLPLARQSAPRTPQTSTTRCCRNSRERYTIRCGRREKKRKDARQALVEIDSKIRVGLPA